MLYEVNSFFVAKNIDYIINRDKFREHDTVVVLQKDNKPLPRMIHGKNWKTVDCFFIADCDSSLIEKYIESNAIILQIYFDKIDIYDLNGFATLELKCKYRDAIEYLETLFRLIRSS